MAANKSTEYEYETYFSNVYWEDTYGIFTVTNDTRKYYRSKIFTRIGKKN